MHTMALTKNIFSATNSFCFISLFLVSIQSVLAAKDQNDGIYIVYTGAAPSSSNGHHCDHIMSSSSIESWDWKDRVLHTYSKAFSGFAARLSKEEAESIARRPEVVSVFPDQIHRIHTTRSWDFLKEQSVVGLKTSQIPTSNISSVSGEDVIIGVFDTGIWPEAKSFSDEGLGPVPSRWKGQCIKGHDFKPFNCNRKLIGARDYVPNENSPRDHNGHGTHVAAITAGRPVPGASFRGDLAKGTAQGGAPGARIAVYRICDDQGDCFGSDILKAMDDSIADGVDILTLSFGSSFVFDFSTNPVSIGAFHAVENGILVVASAGDGAASDHSPYIENNDPWILTVGATTIDRFFESDVVLGNNKVIKGGGVHSANFEKNPIYPLIDARLAKKPDGDEADASTCLMDALDGKKVKGKIVLCHPSEDYATSAQFDAITSLGGIAMIYIDEFSHQLVDSVRGSVPCIPVYPDSDQILAYINSTRNPVATILPTVAKANNKPAPAVAYFSAPGGTLDDNRYLIKPDVAAPGVDILSAWPSNETNEAFNLLSGTSMACPHVSGVAALVKSRNPDFSPSAIKSAIMTTANPTNNLKKPITDKFGRPSNPDEYGSGEVTIFGPLQPGLVYETEIADYLLFLCNQGYNASRLKLISSKFPTNFSCPSDPKEESMSNMNYPSISVFPSFRQNRTVTRTVTNVGDEESVYRVSFEASEKLEIIVSPTELIFTKHQKKLSYTVTFTDAPPFKACDPHGSIIWSNDKHKVRIPFIVRC